MNRYATSLCTALALLVTASVAIGQESVVPDEAARAAHLARMKLLAASIQVFAIPDKPQSEVELVQSPVLRYSDNTRRNLESTLWIWGTAGRPSAIVAIEYYPEYRRGRPSWLYEIASLSTERIAAKRGEDLDWTAKEPGLALAPIADAEPPNARPTRRLAQMKTLRARFAAHEHTVTEGRIELRPLTSPLHRYEDAKRGIVDGAIFSFASGTNPEVLLALEVQESGGKSGWYYGLAQMTGASVTAQLDGKEVWQRGEADPPAVRDSYVNGWIASEPAK